MHWIKKRALSGERLLGVGAMLGSPMIVELIGKTGFDWAWLDYEHGLGGSHDMLTMCQAAAIHKLPAIVRLPSNDLQYHKQALDFGAAGVMVPYVNTAEEAEHAAKCTRFSPGGLRGIAQSTRAAQFALNFTDYYAEADDNVLTVVQIETPEAVSNVDEIAAVDGVDVLFVGPLDLSVSLGFPRQFDHPDFSAALDKVLAAGAKIVSQCRVNGLERDANGFVVQTQLGSVRARKVVIATNGYTGPLTPWHQRRVIPIGSYVIATEPLAREVMDRLLPTNRNIVDTRKLVVYYRASPDRTRILFGGRVSISESDPMRSAPKMRQQLIRLFPELSEIRLSHSWMGFVAYTFDELMHVGEDDGLFYSMGYCGSGVGLASYLGMRVGKQVLGREDGYTPLSEATFSTRPFYTGKPWFLAPSVLYYSIRDRLGI